MCDSDTTQRRCTATPNTKVQRNQLQPHLKAERGRRLASRTEDGLQVETLKPFVFPHGLYLVCSPSLEHPHFWDNMEHKTCDTPAGRHLIYQTH